MKGVEPSAVTVNEAARAPSLDEEGLSNDSPMTESQPPDRLIDQVKAMIAGSIAGGTRALAVDVIAAALALSGRTLQRKLKEHGVSHSALIDDVRREIATTLLARDGVRLCDVAYRLGFSGLTPFYRAFRRWTGTTPRLFQKAERTVWG
jgi:AraC-like DNA-binding protein